MEQNKYEVLEEVEADMEAPVNEVKPLTEYEKILKIEAGRIANEQAKKLIKLGCFEQKEEVSIDFSRYEKLEGKKYKGLYQLYRNMDSFQLVYICPLVENNKGDDNERTDLKPYAYDCLYIEKMDSETYEAVIKAAKHNFKSGIKTLYVSALVTYIVVTLISLAVFFYMLFDNLASGFMALGIACLYAGAMLAVCACGLPLILLMVLKYKKYQDK